MLMALLPGVALPAGQLAITANVAPQTASSHLAKLISGELLSVEQQGRHRYYRLAGADVAAAIESLLAISPRPGKTASSAAAQAAQVVAPDSIAYARTCYSHLAGQLAVRMAQMLEKNRFVITAGLRSYKVTVGGRDWFHDLGIDIRDRDTADPRFARRCLDWTERRHHLAGRLGSALLAGLRELRWVAPIRNSRALRVTLEGRRGFEKLLRSV